MSSTQPTSFRLTEQAVEMLESLEVHMGLRRSAIIETAIRNLYRKEIGKRIAALKKEKESRKRGLDT